MTQSSPPKRAWNGMRGLAERRTGRIQWQDLSVVGERRLVNVSVVVLITVPLVARGLNGIGHLSHEAATLLAQALWTAFGEDLRNAVSEPLQLRLPLNLVRAFWAGAAAALGQLLYGIRCPSILRERSTFETWSDKAPDAVERRQEQIRSKGSTAEHRIELELMDQYRSTLLSAGRSRPFSRACVAVLYASAILLTLRILVSQLHVVTADYDWRQLLL